MQRSRKVVKNITEKDVYKAFEKQGISKQELQFIANKRKNYKVFDFSMEYSDSSQRIKPVYIESLDPSKTEEGKMLLDFNNNLKNKKHKKREEEFKAIKYGKHRKSKKQSKQRNNKTNRNSV